MKILIVEDNEIISNLLKQVLENDRFNVTLCETFSDAKKLTFEYQFDIIILDLILPDGNGLSLCQEIKKNKKAYEKPIVIFITGCNEEEYLIETYTSGAVYYLKKPFNILELTLKITSLSELIITDNLKVYYEKIEIDKSALKIYEDFKEVSVTRLEYDLLSFFIENKGKVFSREKLIETVWKETLESTDRAVDQCIKKIRKKFKSLENKIESIRGIGYKIKN